ncbi:MAG: hypothetical protein A2086_06930 [Spirochaetes bacterium GWD1_27_9]|nr:MAG: hypothetical protein A2Z98_00795 [Spirochaetes bacterium GWB1_27_13]OHD22451.1 MAG: hypothetical protein A2Y34_05335 [Spirochaetes bacterium GWC1_27_15]OHD29343.1 MAG: hypothetical protein A2086_06930 [Spirochaetes bacterium GWD1_27_9]
MKKIFILYFFVFSLNLAFTQSAFTSLLDAGVEDYNKGQYLFAINNFKKFIQISEDNQNKAKAYYFISLSYYFLENYKTSLNYFDELLTKYRFSSYTSYSYFWKGLIYQNLSQWESAEEFFQKYTKLLPNSELIERAYLALANSQIELEKYDMAEQNLKIIADKYKRSEKYEEASVLYAFVLIKNKKFNIAENFINTWITKLGKTGEGYTYKDRFWLYGAELSIQNKDIENAKILLKKIDNFAKESPSSDIALLHLSKIENTLGNKKEAKEYLLRLANEYPYSKYNIDISLSFGIEEYNNTNYSDALVFFKQSLDIIEKNLLKQDIQKQEKERLLDLKNSTLFYIGETYYKIGDLKQAINNYIRANENNRVYTNESILKLLEIYIETKETNKAFDLVSKSIDLFKSDVANKDKFFILKSKAEYLSSQYSNSLKTLEDIINKEKYNSLITSIKVNNYIKLSKIKDAISSIKDTFNFIAFDKKPHLALDLMNLYFNVEDYNNVVETHPLISTYSKNLADTEQLALKIKSDYIAGISYMQLREYDKGILLLKTLQSYPETKNLEKAILQLVYKSFYYIGWMYYKQSNYIDASKNFGAASLLDIEDNLKKDSYYMEAFSFYSKKDYQNASLKFESIYKKYYPDELGSKSYYQMGKCFENLGSKEKAITVYKKIFEEFVNSNYKDDALFELIKDLLDKKKLEEANSLIRIFTDNYSKNSLLYKNILIMQAETFIVMERYSEALSTYNFYLKKFKDEKDNDVVFYWAGYSASKIKDFDLAKEFLENLLSNYSSSSFYKDSLNILKNIYFEEKNYEKEKYYLIKLIDADKNSTQINQYNKRLKEIDLVKNGISEEEANLIIEVEKGNILAKFELGILYYKKNRIKALEILKDLSETNNEDIGGKSSNLLGDNELELNKYQDASKFYLKTTSYKANNDTIAEALYKASLCYYKIDKQNLAKKIIERLKTNFSDSIWTSKAKELEKRFE